MTKGTVKFYNEQRGFGFIEPEDGSKDVFVHATALERAGMGSLAEGQKVSVDTEVDSRSGKTAGTEVVLEDNVIINNRAAWISPQPAELPAGREPSFAN